MLGPVSCMRPASSLRRIVEPVSCPAQDFIREKDLTLRSYGLKEFTALMFKRVPGLEHFAPMVGNIFAQFNAYKQVLVAVAQSAEHSWPTVASARHRYC